MTPEAQRIAILKVCGWHREPEPEGSANPYAWWHGQTRYNSCGEELPRYLPDHLSDLNAMHEAEKTLTDEQWTPYLDHLLNGDHDILKAAFHRDAAQRAEAFLRALNLWVP